MQNIKSRIRRRGFSLIEVLMVIVILGILTATVLPQFTESSANANESALRADLIQMRSQLQVFRYQHGGKFPSGTADKVIDQLTLASDAAGNTALVGTAGYPFGPYLMGQLPTNPYNGGSGLLVKSTAISASDIDPTAMQGTVKVGWIYSSLTGQVIANSIGKATDGRALSAL